MSGPNKRVSRLTLVRFLAYISSARPFYPLRALLDSISSAFSIMLTTGTSYSLCQRSSCPKLSERDATALPEFINKISYPANRPLITVSYCPLQSIGHCH